MWPACQIDLPNRQQEAETGLQHRSRIIQGLNLPKRTLSLFAHCGLVWDQVRLGAPGLGG
jgi:hypothetical protein